jgi:hypothetical protein
LGFKDYSLLFSILGSNLEAFDKTVEYVMERLHQQRSEVLTWPLTIINATAKRQSDKVDKENKALEKAMQKR